MLNLGKKTFSNVTEKRLDGDKSIASYSKQLLRELANDPNNEIIYADNKSGAYNMNDNFAFSGGTAWAVATLLYNELADNSVVPLKFEDLAAFNERLATNFSFITHTSVAGAVMDKTMNKKLLKKK